MVILRIIHYPFQLNHTHIYAAYIGTLISSIIRI